MYERCEIWHVLSILTTKYIAMHTNSNYNDSSILIVDDNVSNLQLLGGVLKTQGYKIQLAQNGSAALASVHQSVPDLILLDIMMPDMDGFEVTRRIRSDDRYRRIPIIFISANNDENSIVRGFECGGQDYVSKPFIKRELLARVHNQLVLSWNERNLSKIIEAKDQFFAQMTTSLKNPLAQLASFSQMLPEHIAQSDYRRAIEYANIIQETAVAQFKHFENLLEWARIQTGHYVPFFEDVDLASSINGVVDLLASKIQSKSLTVNTIYETGIAFADQSLLQTVLRNIIDNAVKFSRPNGTIEITVYDQGATVCISIRDHGEGLDAVDAAKLFDLHTDLHNINSQSEEKGNCMGLRISHALTLLMDGTMTARGLGANGTELLIELASGQ